MHDLASSETLNVSMHDLTTHCPASSQAISVAFSTVSHADGSHVFTSLTLSSLSSQAVKQTVAIIAEIVVKSLEFSIITNLL